MIMDVFDKFDQRSRTSERKPETDDNWVWLPAIGIYELIMICLGAGATILVANEAMSDDSVFDAVGHSISKGLSSDNGSDWFDFYGTVPAWTTSLITWYAANQATSEAADASTTTSSTTTSTMSTTTDTATGGTSGGGNKKPKSFWREIRNIFGGIITTLGSILLLGLELIKLFGALGVAIVAVIVAMIISALAKVIERQNQKRKEGMIPEQTERFSKRRERFGFAI